MSTSSSTRTSIRQVAALAGVSPMTVTNVVRERDIVAPETKARVLDAMRELQYVPVHSAMQNRHVETKVLSVLLDYDATAWYGMNADMFNGLALTAREHGYDLLMHLRRGPEWADDARQLHLLDRRSDGVVLAGLREDKQALHVLAENEVPAVSCFNTDVPAGVAWVVADNAQATRLAVEHLVGSGHTKIAHLRGPKGHAETGERISGFAEAMKSQGLERFAEKVFESDWEAMPDKDTLKELLRHNVTGVVCFNDSQALELWRIAQEHGLEVPRDLSLVGRDNWYRSEFRGLTTITNPLDGICRAAIESLLALIKGAGAGDNCRTVPVELIERNSVAPPRVRRHK